MPNQQAEKTVGISTIPIEIKLSALWASAMSCYIYGDYFNLYVPGHLEAMIAGRFVGIETSETVLILSALLMAIPSLMIFLSLILPTGINYIVNTVLGILYSLIMLATMFLGFWLFYLVLGVIEIAITLAIVGYARSLRYPLQTD